MNIFGSVSIPGDLADVLSEADAIPIRTRGPLPVPLFDIAAQRDEMQLMELKVITERFRKKASGLPLTFVIHDWGTDQASEFFTELKSCLDDQDGVWLVSGEQPSEESTQGVVLDLESETDRRLYNTLVGDLVFFTGQGKETGIIRIRNWVHRATAVVIDEDGRYSQRYVRQLKGSRLGIYVRTGQGQLWKL